MRKASCLALDPQAPGCTCEQWLYEDTSRHVCMRVGLVPPLPRVAPIGSHTVSMKLLSGIGHAEMQQSCLLDSQHIAACLQTPFPVGSVRVQLGFQELAGKALPVISCCAALLVEVERHQLQTGCLGCVSVGLFFEGRGQHPFGAVLICQIHSNDALHRTKDCQLDHPLLTPLVENQSAQ